MTADPLRATVWQRSFAASPRAPRDARQFVVTQLSMAGAPPDVVRDLELAVSELTANAVEHGGGSDVEVGVTAADGEWVVEVSASSTAPEARVRDPGRWSMGSLDRSNGRGLAIVGAVTDVVEVEHHEGRLTVRCRRIVD